jgi:hypothetical protein
MAVLLQLQGQAFFLGDVLLDRDVMGDAPILLAQGGDDCKLDELAAVLSLVDELAAPSVALAQSAPHDLVCGIRSLAGSQQP